MPVLRSTILRLEREINQENARSLAALHHAYEQLTAALLAAARERGYLGSDPFGGLGHLLTPPPLANRIGEESVQLWKTFFANFRPDEAAFEAARFQEKAGLLDGHVHDLAPGERPDPSLTLEILETLSGLWEERHQAINERLDTLIGELSTHQAQLGSVQLATAHQSDELSRIAQVVGAALGEIKEHPPADEPLGQQVGRLVGRYRSDLAASRRHAQGMIAAVRRLLDALKAVATRSEMPPLPPEAEAVFTEVRKLDDARRELEVTVRELRGTVAKLESERVELMEEVAARDRRITRYEAGDDHQLDERLRLYRQAFAAWEQGADPKVALEQVRKLERVVSLPAADEQQAVRALDRHLAELAKCLEDLRGLVPLADDPKRFRPRFFGSKYDFKALRGQVAALRDASRDLNEYLDRARWAVGLSVLAKQVPKLRAVFKEMVSLVAHWREKLGDPPPVSITISMDGGSGILALPAILASDLESVMRKKAKAGPAAASLAPVLGECVALYHRTVEQARGEPIPRVEVPKREGAIQAVTRLGGELSALAAICETSFGEAVAHEFVLGDADNALLADDHLLRHALHNLDGACAELAALPNAPPLVALPLPGRGKDFDKFLACGRQRAEWLEEVALYRVVAT
ncbi:MAG: hypothetical protein H0X38_03430 [Planctomycetes bacterium]|nr:hypothetical protein [Planctomycetota bacterium]